MEGGPLAEGHFAQEGPLGVELEQPADAATGRKMLEIATSSMAFYNRRYGAYDQPEMDVVAARVKAYADRVSIAAVKL